MQTTASSTAAAQAVAGGDTAGQVQTAGLIRDVSTNYSINTGNGEVEALATGEC